MILYSVTITIPAGIESEWVNWMKRVHVPDVLRTGCFSECRTYKVLDSDDGQEPTYVMQYHCPSIESITVTESASLLLCKRSTLIDLPDALMVPACFSRRSQRLTNEELIVRESSAIVALGLVAGLAGALGLTRLLAALFFGVSGSDPGIFVGASLLLVFVAMLACYFPARRAMNVNPVRALRYQ